MEERTGLRGRSDRGARARGAGPARVAAPAATVTVNSQPVTRQGGHFRKELTEDNSSVPQWIDASVTDGTTSTDGSLALPAASLGSEDDGGCRLYVDANCGYCDGEGQDYEHCDGEYCDYGNYADYSDYSDYANYSDYSDN